MSWLISLFLAGAAAVSALPVSNDFVSNWNESAVVVKNADETERFEQTYPLNSNGRVSVSNVSGSIIIETWDRNEVKLEAVKNAAYREDLQKVQIKIDAARDFLRVETDFENWKEVNRRNKQNANVEVNYRLTVPRNAVLDEIQTVNGSIEVTNLKNVTKISAVNGTIKAANLSGTSVISTVNGVINADFESLENVSSISLETVNGTANLTLPSDTDATVKAETVNGGISNDFNLPVSKGKYVGRNLHGRLGTGKIKINLETVNGSMSIRRRQDGRSLKSSVNLLPLDEETFIEDTDTARKNRNSANMQRQIARDTRRVMIEAQKELIKNRQDIRKAQAEVNSELGKAVAESVASSVNTALNAAAATLSSTAYSSKNTGRKISFQSNKFEVSGKPKIKIDAENSKIFVRGWDKSEVAYSVYTVSGENSAVQAQAVRSNSDITLTLKERAGEGFDSPARIEIFVPRKADLKVKTHREIRVEGVSGDLDLSGGEESVNVRDSEGKLSVTSAQGEIRVIGFKGEIFSRNEQGLTSLEGDFQKLSASADSGDIILTLPENVSAVIQSDADVKAEGLNLIKDTNLENLWRIGQGGADYTLTAERGKVFVRSINKIKSNF